jgi:hypothetical protein
LCLHILSLKDLKNLTSFFDPGYDYLAKSDIRTYTPVAFTIIVSNALVKQLFSFNQVYSMILPIKLSEYLSEITRGGNKVGSKRRGRRERKRERERQINGVRYGAFDSSGNGVGWKRPLVKRDT